MAEPVRLVVWDLDETFWRGTLTEGGIREYVDAHHRVVIELARRGIMSSICSKNDPSIVLKILEEKGILRYFIFPDISWEPKGPRLARLIETVGLRAPTVIFIDDNPNNLAEAQEFVPDLQVADESFIKNMLEDVRFIGKDDSGLSRLQHYKLLEQRNKDEKEIKGNNEDFLRSCDIRVYIEYDVERHIDRAIELINRTNQLNFTKKRLPEDQAAARAALRDQMRAFDRTVGLVRVIDKYGDYGFIGFFMSGMMRQKIESGCSNTHLVHFCFSCRTLGMLIEQWLYNFLGRPELNIVGEVLTDLSVPREIDWVTISEQPDLSAQPVQQVAPQIVFYGGCEANAIAVFLQAHTPRLDVFGNYVANGIFVSVNCAERLLDVCDRTGQDIRDELNVLGLPVDLETGNIFETSAPGTVYIVNLAMDAAGGARLRHKFHDWIFILSPNGLGMSELYEVDENALRHLMESGKARVPPEARNHLINVSQHLKDFYELVHRPPEAEIVLQMQQLAERVPVGSKLIILVDHHQRRDSKEPSRIWEIPEILSYRSRMLELAEEYPFLGVVQISNSILEGGQVLDGNHYDRSVYFRVAKNILKVLEKVPVRATAPFSQRRLQRMLYERRLDKLYASQALEFAKASYEMLLRRQPEPGLAERVTKALSLGRLSFAQHIRSIAASNEFSLKWEAKDPSAIPRRTGVIEPRVLRIPDELCLTPTVPKRVLIIGSCLSEGMAQRMRSMRDRCESDLYFVGSQLPEAPAKPIPDYDFQIVQLALRHILPDASFARLAHYDEAEHEKLFIRASSVMSRHLEQAMSWNRQHGLLTFVFPFVVPTQNPVGRLMPRYELRNAVNFIERLNHLMAEQLENYTNAFMLDVNEVYSYYGKRFTQDDILTTFNHGNVLSNYDAKHDIGRLEKAGLALDYIEEKVSENFSAIWAEMVGLYRTVHQIDQVKMVIVDLDDTLWRGVIGDLDLANLPTAEGWPKGLWEALLILKRRGILLGIISKNDETRVEEAWDQVFGKQLRLDDFVAREINWHAKTENMQRILQNVNLLPRNVLYIDDNPVERAAMKQAFPDVRVLGGAPFLWRRILLWAPETQVATITAESSAKTEMVRAQVAREEQRREMGQEAFLESLNVAISMMEIGSVEHPRFARSLELINKTNQFNTTGRRWSLEECSAHFAAGHTMLAFEVSDQYTDYGLVGVLILRRFTIDQFVMSCRVLGLGIETAAVALAGQVLLQRGAQSIAASMVETDRNQPCRDVYKQCGFEKCDGLWVHPTHDFVSCPPHIKFKSDFLSAQARAENVE